MFTCIYQHTIPMYAKDALLHKQTTTDAYMKVSTAGGREVLRYEVSVIIATHESCTEQL